jgi:class 3 adenylate cyclase/tetratricopeptide (TPR) repeat protein
MLVACPHCGERAQAGKYCSNCGGQLEKTCRACSATGAPGARFCAQCGTPFAALAKDTTASEADDASGAQQKQVTVLFADICGSTELVAKMDAEDASLALGSVLGTIVKAMTRFGGVVNRQMGDGVMVLFGAPVATEDHAARACFAALAALDAVQQMGPLALPIRIGICSGPVILRKTGRDDEDYDVAGITAHIAARLEQQAEPGTVLLSQQSATLVAGVASIESIGKIALKGIEEPSPVFRLVSAADRPSWAVRAGARALSTFVGREEELGALAHAIGRASSGQAQAVALVADAGMGKSRLLHEFLSGIEQGAWHIMRVETTARSTAIPYFLITALLRDLVGCSPDDSTEEVVARLPSAIASLGLGREFDAAPLLAHLDKDVAGLHALDPAERNNRLVRSLRPILQRYAELHPLILVVEDYHWLDASSAEVLNKLLAEMDAVRLLLLMTTRPERRPGWRPQSSSDTRTNRIEIELKLLAAPHADHLLRELLGDSDELAPLRAHIIARADGTPFFLEEFARSLHESGVLAAGISTPASIAIPASVQSILAARVDRLSPLHRRILQIGSVIGRDVPLPLLSVVAGIPEVTLSHEMTVLRTAGFLVEARLRTGIVHVFAHALTQAVVYDGLLRSDRRTLHQRVLQVMEAEQAEGRDDTVDHLAHHAVQAAAWPEAARYSLAAGERASRRSALTEAKFYLQTAITALSRQPASVDTTALAIDARLRLRGVLATMNDASGMQEYLQGYLQEADSMAELAGDRANLARVYISRGAMLSHWGDLPGAVELSRSALKIMLSGGDSVGVVGAAFSLGQALWYSGDLEEARQVLMSNVAYARDDGGQQRTSATFVLPSVVFFCYLARISEDLGDSAAAFAAIREAGAIADRRGHTFDQLLVNTYEGGLLLAAGRQVAAIDMLERALGVARANEIEWHIPLIASLLGRAYVDTGRHVDARELLEQASTLADRNRQIGKRLLCSPPLVHALAEGNLAAAKDLGALTLRDATARGFRPIVVQTRLALAHVHALESEPEKSQVELREAAALAKQLGLLREELLARERLAVLLRQGGLIKPAVAEMQAATGLRSRLASRSDER